MLYLCCRGHNGSHCEGQTLNNKSHIINKSKLKRFVKLVKNERRHCLWMEISTLEVVEQSSWRAHYNRGGRSKRLLFIL